MNLVSLFKLYVDRNRSHTCTDHSAKVAQPTTIHAIFIAPTLRTVPTKENYTNLLIFTYTVAQTVEHMVDSWLITVHGIMETFR